MRLADAMTAEHAGPLPAAFGPLSRLAARGYAWAVARRNRRWDAGLGVVTIDRPVISVGNLSVGGTGKTPMVAKVCRWLVDAGHTPAIAMRGYGAHGGLSDEAEEYRRLFGDSVRVVAQPDRLEGLMRLFAETDGTPDAVDCVVLDDGFQHRRIARGLDIVLIDASRDPFTDACLPAGWLREPASSLARAGAVVLTHAELVDEPEIGRLQTEIGRITGAPIAVAEHGWDGLDVRDGASDRDEPVGWLAGRRVFAACAIGNPTGFLAGVEKATGVPLGGSMVLRDHDPYSAGTVRSLLAQAAGCDAVVVTPKDWAKLSRVDAERWACPVVRPRLAMGFAAGEAGLRDSVLACASGTGG